MANTLFIAVGPLPYWEPSGAEVAANDASFRERPMAPFDTFDALAEEKPGPHVPPLLRDVYDLGGYAGI
jgi:hypothetical protein